MPQICSAADEIRVASEQTNSRRKEGARKGTRRATGLRKASNRLTGRALYAVTVHYMHSRLTCSTVLCERRFLGNVAD